MADGVVFALDMKHFGEKIAALGPAGQAKAEAAIVAGAQDMAAAARALVPHKTGHLRETIKVELDHEHHGARVVAGDKSTMVEVRKGSGVYWQLALLIEYGVKKHRAGGLFKGAWIPFHKSPFFWPAYRLMRKRVRARIVRNVNQAFRDVAGK